MKKGVLLINLGTPDATDSRSIRRYLREFLADKRVVTLPAPLRYVLLYGVILPFRTQQTKKAYEHIWTPNGSPLLINSLALRDNIQRLLGTDYMVAIGMRYGNPSIESALSTLSSCHELTILPLFPQYSSAASGSAIEKTLALLSKQTNIPSIRVIHDFHQQPGFITAIAKSIQPYLLTHDHILFSYHGLPQHHLVRGGCNRSCESLCPPIKPNESTCYRAQCFQTTRSIVAMLGLNEQQYSTAFQSRLGKTPWIQPYTDDTLSKLAAQGIKRIAVTCPSFVADCLETLEEIGIRAKAQWHHLGGERLTLIPCLNHDEMWSQTIVKQFLP